MDMKQEFEHLVEKIKVERDEINLKLHLASMEAKDEFKLAEKQWVVVKAKANEIADSTKENSHEVIAKAKIVGEELKDAYQRINKRFSE
jgi:hypothetical protein